MAKRNNFHKVSSEPVQGAGSFVVFRDPPYGMVTEARNLSQRGATPEEQDTFIGGLLEYGVKEWDWVDDDGAPMLTPREGLDIKKLTNAEVQFLVENLTGSANQKN